MTRECEFCGHLDSYHRDTGCRAHLLAPAGEPTLIGIFAGLVECPCSRGVYRGTDAP